MDGCMQSGDARSFARVNEELSEQAAGLEEPFDPYGIELEERRSGEQRRDAFRISMKMMVYVDAPMRCDCELVDISVLGLRIDHDLPCSVGVKVELRLVIPSYGATLVPDELPLLAEVVRVDQDYTGLRFVDVTFGEARAVRELVHDQQRRLLQAVRPVALDRRRGRVQR